MFREIPNRSAICAFGTPSAANLRINAQSSKVITLQSLSAHFSTGRDAQFSAVTDTVDPVSDIRHMNVRRARPSSLVDRAPMEPVVDCFGRPSIHWATCRLPRVDGVLRAVSSGCRRAVRVTCAKVLLSTCWARPACAAATVLLECCSRLGVLVGGLVVLLGAWAQLPSLSAPHRRDDQLAPSELHDQHRADAAR